MTFAILGHLPFILVHDLRDLADWISQPVDAIFAVRPLVTKKSYVSRWCHWQKAALLTRGVAAGTAGRAIALPIFWQETAVTVTS